MMRKENTQHLDEEFAAAADEFLVGRIVKAEYEGTELFGLLNTLERVDKAFSVSAEVEARERIRKNLRRAWFEVEAQKVDKRPSFFDQLRSFFLQNRQRTGFAVSFAMVLLMLVAAPFFFNNGASMAGTAGGLNKSALFNTILLVGLVSTLFWVLKRHSK